jgi:hypothetical protein
MKVKIKENTIVDGEVVKAGTVMEVSDSDYRILKSARKCEPVRDDDTSNTKPTKDSLEYIQGLKEDDLKKIAKELGIDIRQMSKEEAIKNLALAMDKLE